jgi:hypothetical protein
MSESKWDDQDQILRCDSLESDASVSSTIAWQGEPAGSKEEGRYAFVKERGPGSPAKSGSMHDSKADAKNPDLEESIDVKGSDLRVVEDCIDFCDTPEFQSILKEFKLRHCDKFMELSEAKEPDEQEQSLEHTEIFRQYNELIEKELTEEFLKKEGYSEAVFYQSCQDIVDGKFTALFEEHEHQWFIDVINGWMDYEVFLEQMCDLARASNMHKLSLQMGNLKMRR